LARWRFGRVAGGKSAEVLVFLVVQVQSAGERVEDRGAGAGLLAADQVLEVVMPRRPDV
jgi:hypothetical protein